MARLWLATMSLVSPGLVSAQGSLSLSPAFASDRGVSVNLILNSLSGGEPAGIQWTMVFAAEEVLSIDAVAAGSAITAGKQLDCAPAPGTHSCMLTGMNANLIANGVVAVVNLKLADRVTVTDLDLVKTLGSSANGRNLGLAGSSGLVSLPMPAVVQALNCTPTVLSAGESSSCSVTLSNSTGGIVSLTGNFAALTMPASVVVADGNSTGVFGITANDISNDQLDWLTASINGISKSAAIALVAPPAATTLTSSPPPLRVGPSSICKIKPYGVSGGTACPQAPARH
jgi:hypothetical protein